MTEESISNYRCQMCICGDAVQLLSLRNWCGLIWQASRGYTVSSVLWLTAACSLRLIDFQHVFNNNSLCLK